MDPLSQLPVECLERVLYILDGDDCLPELARLLTMNKHIASATLPILYNDPYRNAFHQNEQGKSGQAKPGSYGKLTRTLLSRLPVGSIPKSLLLALIPDPINYFSTTTAATNSSLDYLAHIRHLNIQTRDSWELKNTFLPTALPPHVLKYIRSDEFDQLYQSNPFAPEYACSFMDKDRTMQDYYQVIIVLEAYWCLANPILEQLQSFTIPYIRNIERYHKVVGRFKNLERLVFAISETFEDPFGEIDDSIDDSIDDDFHIDTWDWRSSKQRRDKAIQDQTQFVSEHVRLLKGRLKFFGCLEGNVWQMPTYLGWPNWLHFSAHPLSTDLAHVQNLTSHGLPESWDDLVCSNQSILQRCRALKHLEMYKPRAGMFKWAVQEKSYMEKAVRDTATYNSYGGRRSLAQDDTLQTAQWNHGLVPLQHVTVSLSHESSTGDIDDIVHAFDQTLEVLDVTLTSLDSMVPCLGQGWVDLPVLTTLHVVTYWAERLVVDSQLLTHCPNLIDLRLEDASQEYSCQDIVPYLPAQLRRLGHLHLSGWPALTFDPATLTSTPSLTNLSIKIQYDYSEIDFKPFIPSVEELNQSYGIQTGPVASTSDSRPRIFRPRWTWDWQLPLLTMISLSAEFAYSFEFKILHGCPALESLYLDIRSKTPGEHVRFISDTDLSVPTSNSSSPTSPSSPATERLCLPSLNQLGLSGEWVIDRSIVPLMFAKTFPVVKIFYLEGWTHTTLDRMFKLFRTMPTTYDESVSLYISNPSLSYQDFARYELVEYYGAEEDEGDTLAVRIIDNDAHYRLLKKVS
ncbi:hypothetical protein KI688_010372 [Linnemannia hyalina]|uniref:F-box domain-containing protein n=1 Tax=Linnemannia hyalina TaxID=64524 RepID=A0A9P7XXU1_9FUNG|nr:hypothetical protein KI688_010372 [Linnemannia hyalina]